MASLSLTQGLAESVLFLVDDARANESWELIGILNTSGDDVGLDKFAQELEYPLVLSGYPGVLGAYYSPPIRVDSAGKFIVKFRRTNTTDQVLVALEVSPTKASATIPEEDVIPIIDESNLVTARIVLINIDGTAIKNFGVYFYPMGIPLLVEDETLVGGEGTVGLIGKPIKVSTNSSGVAQLKLVKNARVRVAFEGSNFIRDITVPTSNFSLLGPVTSAPDLMQIVIPEYTNMVRSS